MNWIAYIAIGGLTVASCSETKNETPNESTPKEIVEDVIEEEVVAEPDALDYNPDMQYKVPTPNELFTVIREAKIKYDPSVLNPIENVDKYDDKKAQGLNFGVYSADLAYIANHEVGTEAMQYFKVIRNLSNSLHVENAFDNTVFKRIEENVSKENQDSLLFLSNDTYYKAFSYLEENGREKTLAYIILGGWIESMHILTELGQFEEDGILAEKIGDQKYTLENIMGILMGLQDNEEIQDVMSDLADLEDIYLNLNEIEEGDAETTKSDDGKFVFSGGTKVIVTQEDFDKIKSAIAELRNQVIEGTL